MATLFQKQRLFSCQALHDMLDSPEINMRNADTSLWVALGGSRLTALIMRGKFPIRIVSGIIWGQDKATAQADCERRLREMGR